MSKKIMSNSNSPCTPSGFCQSSGIEFKDIKTFKHILKPLGKFIIIHSKGEVKNSSKFIAIPDGMKETYKSHRIWEDNDNKVYAIGDEVTKVKIGDKVLLNAHTKMRLMDRITPIVENFLGVSFKVDVKNDEGTLINTEEIEKYFAVLEEDIITIIN